ncbi:phorbol-12-myristate-13-acetate-induced protein 1 isoform X1 [Peromyscus leucopus]|uniref:phorbol-12-myristate-13-acetate-induced protein 1 isoform X1 n=2 Tax=Peromyscus leucopus TaxID=10041 RepID=UPI0010A14FB4|nr:phorbol-12-myristate-13-acetate-induced protein 1 isoform X1 [Peromyscus leucopus]
MPRSQARPNAPSNAAWAELAPEFAAQLRRIGDKLYSARCEPDITAVLAEMPGRKARKSATRSPTPESEDLEDECVQLRRIGDKLNLWQKLLNLISKLFNLVT